MCVNNRWMHSTCEHFRQLTTKIGRLRCTHNNRRDKRPGLAFLEALDGDDTLPVWFARGFEWSEELRLLTNREVRLQLASSFDDLAIRANANRVVELDDAQPDPYPF